MRNITHIIRILLLAGLFVPASVFAAGFDIVSVTTNPKTPGPDQDVTISVQSYAVPIDTANIIWYVDKEVAKEGIAEKSFTLHTGDITKKTTVDIVILAAGGQKISKQIIIVPAEIDMLWEAQTYTPPFYKGKALPSFKSLLRVTAIPRVGAPTSNPSEYTYKWLYNRTQSIAGALGKNSVVVPAGWADSQVPISVDVSQPGEMWTGSEYTNIHGAEAKVVFYEQAPLLGTQFNRALSNTVASDGNEFTVHAVPYFFSIDNYYNNELVYTWNLNRNIASPGLDPMNLTVVKQTKNAASYVVLLRVQNPKRILQEGRAQSVISLPQEN